MFNYYGNATTTAKSSAQDKKRWTLTSKSKTREAEHNKKRTSWLGIPMRRKTKSNRSDMPSSDNLSTHIEEPDDNNSIHNTTMASRSEGNLLGTFGVPNYLADTCIEAGPYILDLSTNWQDISPAISSNGFARAVRTLSRVPNMTVDRSINSGNNHNGTSPSVTDLWSGSVDEMVVNSTAENELQARAIFMATRIIQTFPAIYERINSGKTSLSMNPPVAVPAESAIAQLTEQIALRLYTLWVCSTEDPSNSAGRAVGRALSPLVLDNLRQSVELVLNRGGLSLKNTMSLSPFIQQLASPPDSATSDSFSFASSTASSSSSLPQPSSSHLQPQSQNPFLLPPPSSSSASSSPTIRPTIPLKLAAHEAEYAVRTSLQQVFGEHISSARKSQLMERARVTLERCLASERRLSLSERQSMYRFQRLQSPIAWEAVHWRFVVEK
jgi:hypothetical protein